MMTTDKAPERYGRTRIAKIKAAYDDLRIAVRSGDFEKAEAALDRYEQWADYAFAPAAPRPMSSAPKDGTPVLVKIKDDLTNFGVTPDSFGNTHAFCGLFAVMRCRDDIMGWSFAAPVGRGGFSDEWLDGWWPLPAPQEDAA